MNKRIIEEIDNVNMRTYGRSLPPTVQILAT